MYIIYSSNKNQVLFYGTGSEFDILDTGDLFSAIS